VSRMVLRRRNPAEGTAGKVQTKHVACSTVYGRSIALRIVMWMRVVGVCQSLSRSYEDTSERPLEG
jgi:hypothetical protein